MSEGDGALAAGRLHKRRGCFEHRCLVKGFYKARQYTRTAPTHHKMQGSSHASRPIHELLAPGCLYSGLFDDLYWTVVCPFLVVLFSSYKS